ncbi:hypothetical protein FXB39_00800 [Nocardioides sp. BGMRC 2183]|nr:hypothetical protein FXB39_00800 [Nocardioides sp. BGMRC 2183]
MHLSNGPHGYGAVTQLLHWLTVLLLGAQLTVGYVMQTDGDVARVDCDPPGEDRSGGDTSDAEEERLDRAEEECEQAQELREDAADEPVQAAWEGLRAGTLPDDVPALPVVHVLLGITLLVVALARLTWRRISPLPPWDPRLGPNGRRVLHASEIALLIALVAMPVTGLALVIGDLDVVVLHIASHLLFFAGLAVHLAMVVGRGLVPRMLPVGRRD